MEKKPVQVRFDEANVTNIDFVFNLNEKKDSYEVKTEDMVSVENLTNDSFDIAFERKTITTEPFSISVKFKSTVQVVNLCDLKNNEETLLEFANRKKEDIVNKLILPARASLLISNITRECGGALITIPVYNNQKENKLK